MINNEAFLKSLLADFKSELESINLNHQIAIAVYEAKKRRLFIDILKIEKQLKG